MAGEAGGQGFKQLRFCEPLEGGAERLPAARRVFHAVLVAKLRNDGALTLSELKTRLGWFKLSMNALEVEQLVTSAVRHGMIEPLPEAEPSGDGSPAPVRWVPTAEGLKLPPPGGASFEDFAKAAPSASTQIRTALSDWSTIVVGFLAVVGFGAAFDSNKRLAAAGVLFGFLALCCLTVVRAERDLEAAASAWPRFRRERPMRWRWQTRPYRTEIICFGSLVAIGLVLAGWVFLEARLAWLGVAVGILTLAFHLLFLHPLAAAWRREVGISSKAQQRWRRFRRFLRRLRRLNWLLHPWPEKNREG